MAAAATSITLTGHALTALAKWLAIEDGTLVNSELFFEVSQSANAIVALDGTTNEHALNVAIFNVAFSRVISLDETVQRVRVLVSNCYDSDGSTCNFRLRSTQVTAV